MGMKCRQSHLLSLRISGLVASPLPCHISFHEQCTASILVITKSVLEAACGTKVLNQISALAFIWTSQFSVQNSNHLCAQYAFKILGFFLLMFRIKMHEERSTKQKSENDDNKGVNSYFLLDREMQNQAKVLSNTIKQKRKEKAVCHCHLLLNNTPLALKLHPNHRDVNTGFLGKPVFGCWKPVWNPFRFYWPS